MQDTATVVDLHRQIAGMREAYPNLKDHELFVTWYINATVTESIALAADALTGNSKDKGADAIVVDDRAKAAFVFQGKYHKAINDGTEKRSDVLAFAHLAQALHDDDNSFRALRREIDPRVHEKLMYVRECLKKRGYRLKLYFVTTARCTPTVVAEAEQICRRAHGPTDIEVADGRRVLLRLYDYLIGQAPPPPEMDLPLEIGHGVTSECLRRHDSGTQITAWIFSMNAAAVADMYSKAGIRLFARNVRGYLGDKMQVNRGMRDTLEHEPSNFWYYNNGITLVCDLAELRRVGGRDVMHVENPQVINGQQTTRTLADAVRGDSSASVIVKVVEVPRNAKDDFERYDTLVSRIVAATNWQNPILASDLMSNDRRQVELEREFRKLNYCYLRKRQSKSEARRYMAQHQRLLTKWEVAQAVAACELDPVTVRREGKEGLFEKQFYPKVFPTGDPLFYILRYRLMYEVGYASRGYPERAYAKWLVLHCMWSRLAPIVRSKSGAALFMECAEHDLQPNRPLIETISTMFRAALAFYRHNKGSGEHATDVSTFFRRKGLADQFEAYLRRSGRPFLRTLNRRWQRFATALNAMDDRRPKVTTAVAR
jgi:AIPR protein